MKGIDFLKQLAEKAGIPADDKDFAAFMATPNFDNVPDSITSALNEKLMSEKEAKINAGLKSHFTGTALSSVDNEIDNVLAEINADDTLKGEIKAEKSTYKRVPLLVKKIQALEAKKFEGGKGEKAALAAEITKLTDELKATIDKHKTEVQAIKAQTENEVSEYALNAYLSQKNFANKDVPKEVNILTAKTLLQRQLSEKGAKMQRDGNGFKLFRTDDTGLPYSENHKEISFDAFTDSVLSTNKLLSVGNPPKTPTTPPPSGGTPPIEIPAELTDHYAGQIAALSNGH